MKYRRDFHFQYTISADLWYNSWNQFTEGCEKMTDIERLAEEFHACRNILHALGDENRQHMILEMMQLGDCNGACDGTIMEKAHLSRPAVSHHIQVLKDTGILKMRREGTKIFLLRHRHRCNAAHFSNAATRKRNDGSAPGQKRYGGLRRKNNATI